MNKLISGIVFSVLFLLGGCKSLDYVRSTKPVISGESSKSIDELSSCVSSKWSGSGGHLHSLPINNGVSLLVPQPMGGYDVVLDITKLSKGSHYVLYERIPSMTSDTYEQAVNMCK